MSLPRQGRERNRPSFVGGGHPHEWTGAYVNERGRPAVVEVGYLGGRCRARGQEGVVVSKRKDGVGEEKRRDGLRRSHVVMDLKALHAGWPPALVQQQPSL